MKSSILRAGAALACAVSLVSCGGGNTGTLYLAGTFEGVTVDGLILQNNGGSDLVIPGVAGGKGNFTFKDLVPNDSIYNVTVKKTNGVENRPPNTESCTLIDNSGNTGLYGATRIQVRCIIRTHALAGNIAGLGADTVVLINGLNQVAVQGTGASTLPFTMASVSEGNPYGISVLTQPAGKTCTVTNGIGTMGTTDVGNVAVACTANAGT